MYPLGSHIVTSRKFYTHHGIYVGNGQVIHYAGLAEGIKKDCIRKVSLDTFKGTGEIYIYKKEHLLLNERFPTQDIIKRAESRLGENRYRLLWNNCETFANWCTHGDEFSTQTDSVTNRIFWKSNPSPIIAVMPPTLLRTTINKIARCFDKRKK